MRKRERESVCVLCWFYFNFLGLFSKKKKKRKCHIKENVLLVLKSGFVFILFLFKTHLDLNSCDFLFFYLVKINKLIFQI